MLRNFEKQSNELFMQDLIRQNNESVKELARLCNIDENDFHDPREPEGMLCDYAGSESSVEWVRSIRDAW